MVRFLFPVIVVSIILAAAVIAYYPYLIPEEQLPIGTEEHLIEGVIEEEMFEPPPLTITGAAVVFAGGDEYYLIGDVAVGVIFVEGPNYTWSWENKTFTLEKLKLGHNNITEAEPRAYLRWFYETKNATVSVEPMNQSHTCVGWTEEAVQSLGYASTDEYLNELKSTYSADWAFVVLFPYGNKSTSNWYAWTCASSHKFVAFYSNYQARPYVMDRTTMHETLHIFGARDEYCDPGYFCCACGGSYGYLGVPNDGCEAGCVSGYEDDCASCVDTTCVMASTFDYPTICNYTRAQIGWVDNNGNDILDPVDTGQVVTVTASEPSHSAATVGVPVPWVVILNITGGNGTAIYTFPADYVPGSAYLLDKNSNPVSPYSSGDNWVSWLFYEELSNYTLGYSTTAPTKSEPGFSQDKSYTSTLDAQYIIQAVTLSNTAQENYTSVSWSITCPAGFTCNETSGSTDLDSGEQVIKIIGASGDRLSSSAWSWQPSTANLSLQTLSGTSDVTNLAAIAFDDITWVTTAPSGFDCDLCLGTFDISASSMETLSATASDDVLVESWGNLQGGLCVAGGDCQISRDLDVNNTSIYTFTASTNWQPVSGWVCVGNNIAILSPGTTSFDKIVNCSKSDVVTKAEWPWEQDRNHESNISQQYVFQVVNGTNTENMVFNTLSVTFSCPGGFGCNESSLVTDIDPFESWTRTLSATADVIDVSEASSVSGNLSFKNITVENTDTMEFENLTVWMNLNESDVVPGTEYLYYWDNGWLDITPDVNCSDGFDYNNGFYACREDTNANGIFDYFSLKQPHTSEQTYQLGGEIPVPKAGIGETCSSNPDCESNVCCHSRCRDACPYCGDGYCDAGESCLADCPVSPPPTPPPSPPAEQDFEALELYTPYSINVTPGNVVSFMFTVRNTGTLNLSDILFSQKGYSVTLNPASISSLAVNESYNVSVQLKGIPGDFLLGITATAGEANDTELVYIHIHSPGEPSAQPPSPLPQGSIEVGEVVGRTVGLTVRENYFNITIPEQVEISRVESELQTAVAQCSERVQVVTNVSIYGAGAAILYTINGFEQRQLPFVSINITRTCDLEVTDNTSTMVVRGSLPPEVDRVKNYALPAFGLPGLIISFFSELGGMFG